MAEKINDRDFEGTSLPFSNEAEQSVLGAILIDPPSINMILDKLRPEHFYIPQNRRIFEVLCSMSAASQTIDFITVSHHTCTVCALVSQYNDICRHSKGTVLCAVAHSFVARYH